MSNPWDEVESFVRERREREAAERANSESRDAIAELNNKVDGLADALTKFLSRPDASGVPPADAGTNAPGNADGSAAASGANSPPPPAAAPAGGGGESTPELPVEVVRRIDVPRIYTGDDEPSEVQYIDPDSGETKTRKGRRKGRVTTYTVEAYEPAPGDEEVA